MTSPNELQKVASEATRLTRQLLHTLTEGSEQDHSGLLTERQLVLKSLVEIHTDSTPDELSAAEIELAGLKSADQELRDYCQTEKDALAIEMNQSAQRQGLPSLPEYTPLKIPLIDRKA